jgi:hypothetical protein
MNLKKKNSALHKLHAAMTSIKEDGPTKDDDEDEAEHKNSYFIEFGEHKIPIIRPKPDRFQGHRELLKILISKEITDKDLEENQELADGLKRALTTEVDKQKTRRMKTLDK